MSMKLSIAALPAIALGLASTVISAQALSPTALVHQGITTAQSSNIILAQGFNGYGFGLSGNGCGFGHGGGTGYDGCFLYEKSDKRHYGKRYDRKPGYSRKTSRSKSTYRKRSSRTFR